MRLNIPLNAAFMMIIFVIVVLLLVRAASKSSRPAPARVPPTPPPPLYPRRPIFNLSQFILAIPLSPILLPLWVLASLGNLISAPFQLAGAVLTSGFALFVSIIGVDSHGIWSRSGRLYVASGRSIANIFGRLLATFGFGGVVDRLKRQPAPEVPPAAPAPATANGAAERTFPFEDDYRIESHLGSGGSTARLFVVRRVVKNKPVGDRLVLKYFDMDFGSRLEEVIRESRGMQLAKEMGIVIDHRLAEDHFFYVMPYYEGETLTRAAARIHRHLRAEDEMLAPDVRTCLTWMGEILRMLDGYHRHGVIHKDVKPDNVIVTEEGVRLVDLGLLTPLTSALTLTTHGTEYFRDPEMVKMAVAGKRVKDVDAVRFDVYSSGAVLYYLLEGSFPACGPLSRFSRPVPMALSWIVSRAMAEGDKRYPGMPAMRADLDAAIRLLDEGALADAPVSRLPSFSGFDANVDVEPPPPPPSRPPVARVAAAARSVKPLRTPRSRRGGAGIFVRLMIGLLIAVVAAVAAAWLTAPSPAPSSGIDPAPRSVSSRFHAGTLDKLVRTWSAELLDRPYGVSPEILKQVPLHFVADGRDRTLDQVRMAQSRLMEDHLIHRSATLDESLKTVLDPGVTPQEVQKHLLEKLPGDTLPMLVWVWEKPAPEADHTYFVEVRFFYRGMFRYYIGQVHTGGGPAK
ncbi:MAG: hypothetical protein ABFS86_11755 [Planctomycetota bacterium]